MKIDQYYDQLSSREQYRLSERKNLLSPQFPRSLFAYENRFAIVIPEIVQQLKLQKEKTVLLDVGCGDGVYEKFLPKELLQKAIGVDVSAKQLKKAAKYFDKTYQVNLDTEHLPLKANSVDLVICSEMLEHVFSPENVISEISRVLKPRGILIFTTPNVASLQTRLSLLFNGFSPMVNYTRNQEHIRFYSSLDLHQLFAGKFRINKFMGIGSFLFEHWNSNTKLLFPRFVQIIGDRFLPNLANGFLIVAQKNG